MLARAVGVVVLGIELDDAAGRLGEAVHAEQRAAEGSQRRLEHRSGDRRGAVRDRAQRGVVAVRRPWTAHSICRMVGTKTALVTRSRSRRSRTAAASNSLTRMVGAPFQIPRNVHPMPPMWNMGSGVRLTVSPSKPHSGEESTAAERLRWVVSTPFGTPVVPDVYICRTVSPDAPRPPGSSGRMRGEPALVFGADRDDPEVMRDGVRELAGDRHVSRPREQERRAGVLQDGGELGRAAGASSRAPPPLRSWRPRTAAPRPRGRCGRGGRHARRARRPRRAGPGPGGWSARRARRRSASASRA